MDFEGVWHAEEGEIEAIILDYFRNIFKSDCPANFEASLDAIEESITHDMNRELLKDFKPDEVKRALNQMHPTKAPSLDGMPPLFFQKYWDIVGPCVLDCVLQALNSGTIPPHANETYICLVPKTKNPQKISEYRPISLCNVIYKIMSKVLANQLKKILPVVISEAQSAFVPGRLISDNVLVAFETMNTIDQRRKGKEGLMAIKLDMSKAYDRVEWSYLEAIMRRMGFQDRWISLVMMCVSTVTYFVLINGEPRGTIIPTRGQRQGDPISPYLFLLCAEGLSAMIKRKKKRLGGLRGISIKRGAPRIPHIFFADDSIIFYRAMNGDCAQVAEVLDIYEKESGQKLNKEKTSLFFSKKMSLEFQEMVKETFGAQIIHQHEKYLGLPPQIGRSKKKAFNRIKGQVSRKVAVWKGELLSNAGREILIKAVTQVTPTYTMSCFKLPDSLCSDLNSLMGRFWSGQKENERKLAWLS